MGDIVEDMLRKAMTALMTDDRRLAAEVSRMDNTVDRLDEAIKLYVTKMTRGSLDDAMVGAQWKSSLSPSTSSTSATSSTRT